MQKHLLLTGLPRPLHMHQPRILCNPFPRRRSHKMSKQKALFLKSAFYLFRPEHIARTLAAHRPVFLRFCAAVSALNAKTPAFD
jgi:hypothetical protein